VELESFQVTGFRSLASTADIPIRRPTILTGANDGGKTASLDALRFLLEGRPMGAQDRTMACMGEKPPGGRSNDDRYRCCVVTGRFLLAASEQEEFGIEASTLHLRRVAEDGVATRCEVQRSVPADPDLQGIDDTLTLAELQARAARLGVRAEGRATAKRSYLLPLQRMTQTATHVDTWMPAPRVITDRLPRYLGFSSTSEPDPAREIQVALKATFAQLLEDKELVGPVRRVEQDIRTRLEGEAAGLCAHIRARCPELTEIQVVPSVSFVEGFRGVEVVAARGEERGVGLDCSGSGRRRRVSLAVWEWTRELLHAPGAEGRGIVIAYDEPDTHLDYRHQRDLVELIRAQASAPGVRIVVATHSLNLIDKVDIGDVVHLALEDGRTVVHRLVDDDHDEINRHLTDLSAAMGLRNSVLLHERCFVVVEGATEAQAIPILFRIATGMSLQSAGIALIAGNSNDGALKVAQFLNDHGRRVHFMLDADSATNANTRKLLRPERLRAIGISNDQMDLVGGPNEIEELFSDEQWAATANACWPRVDGQPWSQAEFAALRGADKFSADLRELVRSTAEDAPTGKPGYLLALARQLHDAEEVPKRLREVFEKLVIFADSEEH
jgi:hypothetical protein